MLARTSQDLFVLFQQRQLRAVMHRAMAVVLEGSGAIACHDWGEPTGTWIMVSINHDPLHN